MKICPNCGTENDDNEKICYLCECDLDEVAAAPPATNTAVFDTLHSDRYDIGKSSVNSHDSVSNVVIDEKSNKSGNTGAINEFSNSLGSKKVIIAVIAIVAAALVGGGAVLFMKSKNDSKDSKSTSSSTASNAEENTTTASTDPVTESTTTDVETTTEPSTDEEKNGSWSSAYAEQLKNYMNSPDYDSNDKNGSMFDLYDINGDYIPELFISDGEYHEAYCRVYSFVDSKCISLLNDNFAYGTLYGVSDKSLIIHSSMQQGKRSLYISKFDGKEVSEADSFNDNIMNADFEDVYYKKNGQAVSEDEYIDSFNNSLKVQCISGRKNV